MALRQSKSYYIFTSHELIPSIFVVNFDLLLASCLCFKKLVVLYFSEEPSNAWPVGKSTFVRHFQRSLAMSGQWVRARLSGIFRGA